MARKIIKSNTKEQGNELSWCKKWSKNVLQIKNCVGGGGGCMDGWR